MAQWLRLRTPNAWSLGSIPGQGTRFPRVKTKVSTCHNWRKSYISLRRLKIPSAVTKTWHSQRNKYIYILKASSLKTLVLFGEKYLFYIWIWISFCLSITVSSWGLCILIYVCDNMYHTYILRMIFKHLLRDQELRTSHWCFSLNSKAEPQARLICEWFTQEWTGKENLHIYVLSSWLLQGVNDCWIFGML